MRKLRLVLKILFAAFFVGAGVNHFLDPSFYLRIMPPYLPLPLLLVYVSGVLEIALGVSLLVPKLSRAAAWGLVALLVAVSPANIHMAVNHEFYPEYHAAALWARVPLQLVLLGWAYVYTRPVDGRAHDGEAAA